VRRNLHDPESDDLSSTTTPEERISMMWTLAKAAFAIAGYSIDSTPRSQWPGRLTRNGSK